MLLPVEIFAVEGEVVTLVVLDAVRLFEGPELRIGIEQEVRLEDPGQVLDPLDVVHDVAEVKLDRFRIVRVSPRHGNVDLWREAVHLLVVVYHTWGRVPKCEGESLDIFVTSYNANHPEF